MSNLFFTHLVPFNRVNMVVLMQKNCFSLFFGLELANKRASRKVLGVSMSHVSFLLIREFVVLLVIASAIASPMAWYFLQGWIEGFIYRTSIGVAPFVIATLLAGLIVVCSRVFVERVGPAFRLSHSEIRLKTIISAVVIFGA